MRYDVEVREIIITNVMVEADSKEEAADKAREAVEEEKLQEGEDLYAEMMVDELRGK